MGLEIEIVHEGAGKYKAWPQNLEDEFRGAAGEGETPKEAAVDLFDDLGRTSFKSWTGQRRETLEEKTDTFRTFLYE